MADVIEEIKENVKKGEEALEEVIEEVEDKITEKSKSKTKKKSSKIKTKKSDSKKKTGKSKSVKKDAEDESTTKEKSLEKKKKELLEKAKKLKGKVDTEDLKSEDLKEKVKLKKKSDMLIPLEEYVRSGIYLGTRVVTPDMKPFVYRRRADGLAIFNTNLIDEKIREGIEYLSKFDPEDVIVVCKREASWKAVKKFGELTGIRVFAKKYPAGILTNKALPDFFENELTVITDHWVDKNALNDTLRVKKKVLMICDTNNFSKGANQVIIGNNKSPKSIGLIYYLLTREYMKAKGMDTTKVPDLDWWTEEADEKTKKALRATAGIMTPGEGYGI